MKNETFSQNTPIECIPGVSTVRKKSFVALKIDNLGSLIGHFPRGYQNRNKIYELNNSQKGIIGL